jgi:subtilisin family serine protease
MVRAVLISLALAALPSSALAAVGHERAAQLPRATLSRAPTPRFARGELLVRFKQSAGLRARATARRDADVGDGRPLPLSELQLVRLRAGMSLRSALASLQRNPDVLYAQPNFYYRLAALPNDPRLPELWGLQNTGQPVRGTSGAAGADIDAPEAWDVTTGSRAVTVAIADSGVAYDHPDLQPNLWRNPGESGGGRESNGRDDDHDGLIDDWRGWDFADNDNDPRDLNDHGTHVAGIVGARGNNGLGTTGVDWQVSLMALRVARSDGLVSDKSIIRAFDYAAARGAKVVNASFVSVSYSEALREAIRSHPKTLFVAAAGNGGDDGSGDDNDRSPQYPCSFTLVNLICVGASDQSDRLTTFSNYGAKSVDLAAPGANVLSAAPAYATVFGDGFETDLSGMWVTGGTNDSWGRVATVAHGGSYSLSDSPGTAYLDNTDSFVRTAGPFSLSGRLGCRVDYALRLSTEPDVDRLLLELSGNGLNWTPISDSSGSSGGSFLELSDDISRFDGTPALYLRFRLVTNGSVTADGAQLDDVALHCLGSSYTGSEFVFNDGTSMAAPYVSGAAALIWSKYRGLGVAGVRQALLRGVDPVPAMAGRLATGGRLNARAALQEARKLAPKVVLTGAARQRSARKGGVAVYARCRPSCVVVATGNVSVSGPSRVLRLGRVARSLAAGKRKRLVLKLGRRAGAGVRRALARHKRVIATVTARATDRRGAYATAKRTIKLAR